MRQLGVNVYWENTPSDPDDYVRGKAQRVLDYIVSLGANSVSFSFPIFTDGITSNRVFAGPKTPSPNHVLIALEEAAARGLRATIRPILNEDVLVEENPRAWRGTIAPASLTQWFASYHSLVVPYAQVAQSTSSATFVIGTELNSLEGKSGWSTVVSAVTAVYSGELGYSMNYDSFALSSGRSPVTPPQVDAYPPIAVSDRATVDELVRGWTNWLDDMDPELLSTVVLSEVGIAAQNGAYRHPGMWGSTNIPLNLDVQRNWYEAVCRVVFERGLAGVYWWHVNFDIDPLRADPAQDDRLTFVGRPAEQAIRNCFALA